ncbi:hypothetical protein E6O75_ATG07748 [Venturia nashicola]|uniref:SET domain-containing protein n=1 Tax=Venturia nashicola TaxID=86259 RepID=A0A4Z1PFP3_9PEZI|nr:hypothetical protein E6O75_ATG07748 [Venturia nashicola]
MSRSVLFLAFANLVLSLHIINPETCSIPYLVPLAFQRFCDLSDGFYEPTIRVAVEGGGHVSFVVPPRFAASAFHRRRPNLWTHEPFCLESMQAKNTFCVYTNAKFARGRGISLISTPEQILDVGSTPIFKDEEHMNSPNVAPGARKYSRTAVPGEKQFLMKATAAFKRGENIHNFTPVLAIQHDANDLLLERDLTLLLRVGVHRLPVTSQTLFLNQYYGGIGDDFIERIDKNSFTSYVGKTNKYFLQALPENAVSDPNPSHKSYTNEYASTKMLNHDCRPNTAYQFDARTFTHLINTDQPIKPGSEITISYVSPYMNSTERRAKLKEQWGFTCQCSLCTAPPKRIQQSDTRVARMIKLANQLVIPFKDRRIDVEKAERLVKLHEMEKLWAPIANAQALAAMEYWENGNYTIAATWAKKAMESYVLWTGDGHQYFPRMMEIVEKAASWKKEKKKGWW